VFQGGQLSRQPEAPRPFPEPVGERIAEVVSAGEVDAVFEAVEPGEEADLDVEPQPATIIDTTAEMLAQAAGKGKRAPRAARGTRPAASRKPAVKKPVAASGRRPPRGRKGHPVEN